MNKETRNNLLEMKYLIKTQDYYRSLTLYNNALFDFGKMTYDLFNDRSFDNNDLFNERSKNNLRETIINQYYKIISLERSYLSIKKDYDLIKAEFEVYKYGKTRQKNAV